MGGKKFGVLLCAEDSDFVKKMYGGYFGVFVKMLAEEGETWDLYRVACGEFPEDDEVESYDGFVISGSSRDAHGNDAWICRLLTLLTKLDSLKKKVLGICFGHQVFIQFPFFFSIIQHWSLFYFSLENGNANVNIFFCFFGNFFEYYCSIFLCPFWYSEMYRTEPFLEVRGRK